jgi:hypothetical protein
LNQEKPRKCMERSGPAPRVGANFIDLRTW